MKKRNEWSLEKFLPYSFLQCPLLKRKEVKRLLNQNLEWLSKKQFINRDEVKLEYLNCLNDAHLFMGRIFLVTLIDQKREAMLIIGARCGISIFTNLKTKSLKLLTTFEFIESIIISWQSDRLIRVDLHLDNSIVDEDNDSQKILSLGFLKEDFLTFLYLLQGYIRAFVYPIKNSLCPIHEIKSKIFDSLNVPAYLVKHPNSTKENDHIKLNDQGQLEVEKKVVSLGDLEPRSETTCSTPSISTTFKSDMNKNLYENDSAIKRLQNVNQILKLKSASENLIGNNRSLRQQLHDELMERIKQRVKILKPVFNTTSDQQKDLFIENEVSNFEDIKLIDDTSTATEDEETTLAQATSSLPNDDELDEETTTTQEISERVKIDNQFSTESTMNLKLLYDASSSSSSPSSQQLSPQSLIYESILNFNESFSSYDVKGNF